MIGILFISVFFDRGMSIFDYTPPSHVTDILSKNALSLYPKKRPLSTSIFMIRATRI
jgi:hypothetical protein